ncbi:hypothetical protein OG689_10535 [Kitasatospora sp. NBC_00240]|uniref:hypothetical protein n=1 Tax=Kitasatospora sp. NBC_00240 TaxID=2903567 RepID=UPI00224D18E0|nr:hypothetical protein [Kitasatospora sp. NBC_00240]MCX5209719.1 hypothetical protein [Kitasatospora sp. NBC_00240]
MARGHGRVLSSIWEDNDFLALDREQQGTYFFLISQPNLNHAGLLPLTLKRWTRKARGLTAAGLEKTLNDLDAARFIVVDEDTEELLIRSFIRNDGVWKQPKVMGAAVSGALEISSRHLRRALLEEMDRIPLHELSNEPGARHTSIRQEVAGHIETLRNAFWEPAPTPPARPLRSLQDGDAEPHAEAPPQGGPKGSTRARAQTTRTQASRALSPAPAPTPVPYPVPPTAGADAPHPAVTAQTLVGEWLDHVPHRPPGNVIGQASKHLKQMLDEGVDPDHIRRGLALWTSKGLHPSALPSVVNEAMNANVIRLAATGTGGYQGPYRSPSNADYTQQGGF